MSIGALLLAAPYALIETRDTDKTDTDNFQVLVQAVDGKGYMGGRDEMKLEPGGHFIVMSAMRSDKNIAKRNHDKSLYLAAKPCFRYLVTGQVKSDLDKDWTVRVLRNERILSCKTKEEIEQEKLDKKAGKKEKSLETQSAPKQVEERN